MTDFNQQGQSFNYLAIGQKPSGYGTLQKPGGDLLGLLSQTVSKSLEEADDKTAKALLNIHACLQRFHSFLLRSSRMAHHSQEALKIIPPPGAMIAAGIDDACIDFESLLFHGRAALDRLTYYLCTQHYNQPNTDRFSKLKNVLINFNKKDVNAKRALGLLDKISPSLEGILVNTEFRSLRSALIHRRSVSEITTLAYTVHRLRDGRILRFDYEVQSRPLLATSRTLAQSVTFLILNALSLYLRMPNELSLQDCEPTWQNMAVCFSAFVDPTRAGPRMSVAKMLPNGFRITTDHLRGDVFSAATKVDELINLPGAGNKS